MTLVNLILTRDNKTKDTWVDAAGCREAAGHQLKLDSQLFGIVMGNARLLNLHSEEI